MDALIIDISMPREQYLTLYTTYIKNVRCVARTGQSVLFPVSVLKPFVTREGIHGTFCLRFDSDKKFRSLQRV
ncbi:MAG: hypothetical protein ACI81O_001512 [Cyclobacteriaceae bacterium]|jgi:hypothetical protein